MRKSFFPSAFQSASLFLLVVGGIGCTTTVTAGPPGGTISGACNVDTSVACARGQGYTCDNGTTPDELDRTIACSSGRAMSSGLVAYCCAATGFPTTSSSCSADASVTGCEVGSYGFSCTGSTRPDDIEPSLVCSDGVVNGSSTDYCCITGYTSSTCSPDATIATCQGASYGFRCTGTSSPEAADPSLVCSSGIPSSTSNTYEYCCETAGTTSGCGADPTVTGCVGGSSGYTCSGSAVPDPSLNCSSGVPGVGQTTVYCCGGTTAGSCSSDPSLTCGGGSSGYSCTGTTRPDADGSLQCSSGVASSSGSTGYCCYSAPSTTASTCKVDPTVTGCTGGSYGFACGGTDTPADSNTQLVCGPGAAGNDGNTLYCCASK